jgi:hypothetical protein
VRILGSTLQADARPYLEAVHAPVLLLHDTHNALVPDVGMRWLAEHLDQAEFRLVAEIK